MVHLALFVRQLAGTKPAVRVDHVGRDEFFVPCRVRLFEEEPDEPALELGTLAAIEGEARSGHLGAEFKVDELALFGDVPVGLFVVLQGGSIARSEGLDVVFGVASCSDVRVGGVGDVAERVVDLRFQPLHLLFQFAGLRLEGRGLRLYSFGFFLFALPHEPTDFPTQRIALGQGVVQFGLGFSALSVPFENLLNRFPCIEMTLVECGEDAVFVVAQRLDGEHGCAADLGEV